MNQIFQILRTLLSLFLLQSKIRHNRSHLIRVSLKQIILNPLFSILRLIVLIKICLMEHSVLCIIIPSHQEWIAQWISPTVQAILLVEGKGNTEGKECTEDKVCIEDKECTKGKECTEGKACTEGKVWIEDKTDNLIIKEIGEDMIKKNSIKEIGRDMAIETMKIIWTIDHSVCEVEEETLILRKKTLNKKLFLTFPALRFMSYQTMKLLNSKIMMKK